MRTMDNPSRIVAYEVADSIADELDTLTVDKARDVWNKIIARNRQKKPDGSLNTVGVATTPEGFRFVYERWQKNPAPGYRLIKATTMSNAANLPDGYIDSCAPATRQPAAGLPRRRVRQPHQRQRVRRVRSRAERLERDHPGQRAAAHRHGFQRRQDGGVVNVLRDGDPHCVDELTGSSTRRP
jgi:hypothetical protein